MTTGGINFNPSAVTNVFSKLNTSGNIPGSSGDEKNSFDKVFSTLKTEHQMKDNKNMSFEAKGNDTSVKNDITDADKAVKTGKTDSNYTDSAQTSLVNDNSERLDDNSVSDELLKTETVIQEAVEVITEDLLQKAEAELGLGIPKLDSELSEEDIETASEIIAALMNNVAIELNMQPEELENMLEDMNIQPAELLQPKVLTEVVLKANGSSDISEVLTDMDISNQLQSVLEMANEATQELVENTDVTEELLQDETSVKEFAEIIDIKMETAKKTGVNTSMEGHEIPDEELEEMPLVDDKQLQNTDKNSSGSKSFENEMKESRNFRLEHLDSTEMRAENSPLDSFINRLEAAAPIEEVTEVSQSDGTVMREIVYQLVEQVKVSISETHTSMEMTLNPESLGRISMNIVSKNGVMTAELTTQNVIAKEAIESQIQILQERIENQGIKVEAIEVTVSDFAFSSSKDTESGQTGSEQSKGNKQGRRNISLTDEALTDMTDEEALAAKVMKDNGGTVDYVA